VEKAVEIGDDLAEAVKNLYRGEEKGADSAPSTTW